MIYCEDCGCTEINYTCNGKINYNGVVKFAITTMVSSLLGGGVAGDTRWLGDEDGERTYFCSKCGSTNIGTRLDEPTTNSSNTTYTTKKKFDWLGFILLLLLVSALVVYHYRTK